MILILVTNAKGQRLIAFGRFAEKIEIKIKESIEIDILATKKKLSHFCSIYLTSCFKKEMKNEK